MIGQTAGKDASPVNQEKAIHTGTKRRTSTILPKDPKAYEQHQNKRILG
jgi:hypothetical protein